MIQCRDLLFRLLDFDKKLNSLIKNQPNPFNLDHVKSSLFPDLALDTAVPRYSCMGHVARHIGRYKNKFIVVQAHQNYVNIYRDDISKIDPFQTLPIDAPLTCSI